MKFSIWLVVLLALMPAFVLFAGLSAAGGFRMPVEWVLLTLFGFAAIFLGWEARRELHDRLD
jgi:membrane protein implicated in regulation of membrane protease activity